MQLRREGEMTKKRDLPNFRPEKIFLLVTTYIALQQHTYRTTNKQVKASRKLKKQ